MRHCNLVLKRTSRSLQQADLILLLLPNVMGSHSLKIQVAKLELPYNLHCYQNNFSQNLMQAEAN